MEDLQRLSINEKIPIAIVGGLGAIRYGYPAATQDINIAVAQNQLAKLILSAPDTGSKSFGNPYQVGTLSLMAKWK